MDNETRQPAPQRRASRKDNAGCGGALLYLIIILGISIILSMILLFSANDVFAFIKENRPVTVTVEQPTTVTALSDRLDEEGIVHYGTLFKLFAKVTGKDDAVPAGDYVLNPAMDYNAIVRNLKLPGDSTKVSITIPEGYTLQQIRTLLIDRYVCTEADLDQALTTYPFKHDCLKSMTPGNNWLEGYLFPDTYEFLKGEDPVMALNKMLLNYESKYDASIADGAKQLNRTQHEITSIASMLEREAQKQDELATIAGVIYNRLQSDMPLQIDATIQYAVGHKEKLTTADLEVESPYNTYLHKGLPPGPIANPGYSALYAASHPQSHDYYYYVAMPDGSHLFARTLTQHNRNVQLAKEAFTKAGK